MKLHIPSVLWFSAASIALGFAFFYNPPGHLPWVVFLAEESPLHTKLWYLLQVYIWPGIVSFVGVMLFQFQFRLSGSGKPAPMIFGMCVLASMAMFAGIRAAAMMPNSVPSYVTGMALSYTVLSRIYAIQMKQVCRGVQVPWVIWRGNRAAVAEIDRRMMQARGEARGMRPAA